MSKEEKKNENEKNTDKNIKDTDKKSDTSKSSEIDADAKVTTSSTWVKDAFSAASNFFSEKEVTDELGMIEPWMIIFKNIVKGINRVLIVLLIGLSTISLAVVGIRYFMAAADPAQKGKAKTDLHIVFKGMIIGFGAFTIWKIVMIIVNVVIDSLAK